MCLRPGGAIVVRAKDMATARAAVFRLGLRQLAARLDTSLPPLTNVQLRLRYPALGHDSGELCGKVLAEEQQGVAVTHIRLTSVDAVDQKIIAGFLGV